MVEVNICNVIKFQTKTVQDMVFGLECLREDVRRGIRHWESIKQQIGNAPYRVSYSPKGFDTYSYEVTDKDQLFALEVLLK